MALDYEMQFLIDYWPYYIFMFIAVFLIVYMDSTMTKSQAIFLTLLILVSFIIAGCTSDAGIGSTLMSESRGKYLEKNKVKSFTLTDSKAKMTSKTGNLNKHLEMKCANIGAKWERCENLEVVCYSHGHINRVSCFKIDHYKSEQVELIDNSLMEADKN